MNSNTELILIYSVIVPFLLTLLWLTQRSKRPSQVRLLAESMTFFNNRSNLIVDYWKNSKFQPK